MQWPVFPRKSFLYINFEIWCDDAMLEFNKRKEYERRYARHDSTCRFYRVRGPNIYIVYGVCSVVSIEHLNCTVGWQLYWQCQSYSRRHKLIFCLGRGDVSFRQIHLRQMFDHQQYIWVKGEKICMYGTLNARMSSKEVSSSRRIPTMLYQPNRRIRHLWAPHNAYLGQNANSVGFHY